MARRSWLVDQPPNFSIRPGSAMSPDIARLAADDPVGHSEPAYLTEHGQQLQYGDTNPGSEIEGAHPGLFVHVLHGQAMRLGYIHDVDVVAYTGAIDCVVVVAIHLQALESPDSHLHQVGQHIAGHSARVLTQLAAQVGTD